MFINQLLLRKINAPRWAGRLFLMSQSLPSNSLSFFIFTTKILFGISNNLLQFRRSLFATNVQIYYYKIRFYLF